MSLIQTSLILDLQFVIGGLSMMLMLYLMLLRVPVQHWVNGRIRKTCVQPVQDPWTSTLTALTFQHACSRANLTSSFDLERVEKQQIKVLNNPIKPLTRNKSYSQHCTIKRISSCDEKLLRLLLPASRTTNQIKKIKKQYPGNLSGLIALNPEVTCRPLVSPEYPLVIT